MLNSAQNFSILHHAQEMSFGAQYVFENCFLPTRKHAQYWCYFLSRNVQRNEKLFEHHHFLFLLHLISIFFSREIRCFCETSFYRSISRLTAMTPLHYFLCYLLKNYQVFVINQNCYSDNYVYSYLYSLFHGFDQIITYLFLQNFEYFALSFVTLSPSILISRGYTWSQENLVSNCECNHKKLFIFQNKLQWFSLHLLTSVRVACSVWNLSILSWRNWLVFQISLCVYRWFQLPKEANIHFSLPLG